MVNDGRGTAWHCRGLRLAWSCAFGITLGAGMADTIAVPVKVTARAGQVLRATATIAPPGRARAGRTSADQVRIGRA
jgi:hypothetical protein